MSYAKSLMEEYYSWLKNETTLKDIKDYIEVTSPYLDRNNDYIQIYIEKKGESYRLTDDGATIASLEQEGYNLKSKGRQAILKLILNGYGIKENRGVLCIEAEKNDFPLKKHALLQAMLSLNDMFYLTKSYVKNLFFEDVQEWLDASNIRYVQNTTFAGVSGYLRRFDFVVPKSSKAPERMIKLINNPTKNNVDTIIMDWIDTQETRPKNSKAYAFINDRDKEIIPDIKNACKNYNIIPLAWNNREFSKKDLAA